MTGTMYRDEICQCVSRLNDGIASTPTWMDVNLQVVVVGLRGTSASG